MTSFEIKSQLMNNYIELDVSSEIDLDFKLFILLAQSRG